MRRGTRRLTSIICIFLVCSMVLGMTVSIGIPANAEEYQNIEEVQELGDVFDTGELQPLDEFQEAEDPIVFSGEDEDTSDYLIQCTEREAFDRGYDYYRAWWICNKGNYGQLLYGWNPSYYSVVEKNRRDPAFQSRFGTWKILTMDLPSLLPDQVQKRKAAVCEALLFNLLYDDSTASFDTILCGVFRDEGKFAQSVLKNLQINNAYKLQKAQVNLADAAYSEDAAALGALIMKSRSTFSEVENLSFVSDVSKFLQYATTVADYSEKLTKVQYLAGSSDTKSVILNTMSGMARKAGEPGYSDSLFAFATYLSESITEADATALFVGDKTVSLLWDVVRDGIFKKVLEKMEINIGYSIAEGVSGIGKFALGQIFGTGQEFDDYQELEVYYDMEQYLKEITNDYVDQMMEGDVGVASRFLVAYSMLENMYDQGLDKCLDYYEKKWTAGAINDIWPGINGDKYQSAKNEIAAYRSSMEKLFRCDAIQSNSAYSQAARRFCPDLYDRYTPEPCGTIDYSEATVLDTYKSFNNRFHYEVYGGEVYLDKDIEVYGSLIIRGGHFYTNSHSVKVYGNLFVENYGSITITDMVDIGGDVYQYSNDVLINAGGSLKVGGEYIHKGGILDIKGGVLTIAGNLTQGYINEEYDSPDMTRDIKFNASSNAKISVGGDFIVKCIRTSDLREGTMTVGGSWLCTSPNRTGTSHYISGLDSFTVTFTGTQDVTLQNLTGMNIIIENAANINPDENGAVIPRGITFKEIVAPKNLSGGDMVITSEGARLGAILQNDVIVNGDSYVWRDLKTNGHNIRINGNLDAEVYYCPITVTDRMTVDGNFTQRLSAVLVEGGQFEITGNYEQRGNELTVKGGQLDIGVDFVQGYINGYDTGDFESDLKFNTSGGAKITVGRDYLVKCIRTSDLREGTMMVGGSWLCTSPNRTGTSHYISGLDSFTVTFTGTQDVTLQNLTGMNIIIENAANVNPDENGAAIPRGITFKEIVAPKNLSGGDMVITSEGARLGAILQNDVIVNGDSYVWRDLKTNGHNIRINGNLDAEVYYCPITITDRMTVDGNFTQRLSAVVVEGGQFEISGNYEQRGNELTVKGGQLDIGVDFVQGYINEYDTGDFESDLKFNTSGGAEITVGRDYLVKCIRTSDLREGTMTVGGSWICTSPNRSGTSHYISGLDSFTVTFTGTQDVTLQNLTGMNIIIENAANVNPDENGAAIPRGITFKEIVAPKNLSGGDMVITSEGARLGAILQNDVIVNGDSYVWRDLKTNGHNIRINGNLDAEVYYCPITVTDRMTVDGNFTQRLSAVVVEGGQFEITGNYEQRGNELTVKGGQLDIGGDFIQGYINEHDTAVYESDLRFNTSGGAKITVGRDYLVKCVRTSDLREGTMTVGGSWICTSPNRSGTSHYISGLDSFTVTFTGTQDVTLQNLSGMNIVIENAANVNPNLDEEVIPRKIFFKNRVCAANLSGGKMVILPENLQFGAILQNDIVIGGDVRVPSVLNTNGYAMSVGGNLSTEYYTAEIKVDGSLTVTGDLQQPIGNLTMSSGSLMVMGDYILAEGDSSNYTAGTGLINATSKDDEITVCGDMLINSTSRFAMTSGCLNLAGNFTYMNANKGSFSPTGSHKTRFTGNSVQYITFEKAYSKFNIVEFVNSPENVIFNPGDCYQRIYVEGECLHENTELRSSKKATCTENGYTGDSYCKDCGEKLLTGDVVKATGHTYNAGVVTTAPTTKTKGLRTYTCRVCGATKTEDIPAIVPTYRNPIFSWAKDGKSCTVTYVALEDNSDTVKFDCVVTSVVKQAPACEVDGITTYTATYGNDKSTLDVADLPMTGHLHTEVRHQIAPTYKMIGYTGDTYCIDCDKKLSEGKEIAKLKQKKQKITVSKTASKTVTYKAKNLKTKKATFSIGAKAKGKITYKVSSTPKKGKKLISVSSAGKVTMKKGAPKGTYKVLVTAAETKSGEYAKATKTITIKVK